MKENIIKFSLYQHFYQLLDQWLYLKENGKTPASYFKDHQYNNLAIYGMGTMALHLIKEVETFGITVKYTVNMEDAGYYTSVPYYTVEDEWEDVDALVVTDARKLMEAKELTGQKGLKCVVVTLDEVLYWEV